jgi:DNA-binding NarL/FixJ family response regulator
VTGGSRPVRVVVADDETVVRDGLAMMLGPHPDLEVVGLAADGVEALSMCRELAPDVALLDIRMPRMDGLTVLRRLRQNPPGPMPRVVVLTTFDVDEYVEAALAEGAVGFLLKSSSHEEIVAAVRAAASDRSAFSAPVMDRLVDSYLAQRAEPQVDPTDEASLRRLTVRELEVLGLLGEGLGNREIADRLVVSLHTVKTHVSRILAKTGSPSRGHAAAMARRCQGLLDRLLDHSSDVASAAPDRSLE